MDIKIITIPTYKDLFDEDIPELDNLLSGISSHILIRTLCLINAQVVVLSKRKEFKTQIQILTYFLKDQDPELIDDIIRRLFKFYEGNNRQLTIFSEKVTQEFISYSISKYEVIDGYEYSTEDELSIFKAYFIFSQKLDSHHEKIGKKKNHLEIPDELFWQMTTWPLLIDQYQFNVPRDVTYKVFRIFAAFIELSKNEDFSKYVDEYKKAIGSNNIYVHLINLAKVSRIAEDNYDGTNMVLSSFKVTEHHHVYEELAIDPSTYDYSGELSGDFIQLRSKPLYADPYNDHVYWVFNWNYLKERIYVGIIKDFYDKTSINKEKKFRRFTDILSYMGENVGEKRIFANLSSHLFGKKHAVLRYDDGLSGSGLPDLYIRYGKYIFLFEVKDSLMASRIVDSTDYEILRKDVYKKFVESNSGKPKGVGQLIKQIEKLNKRWYDFDDLERRKLKRRNVVVYPIIVYTHSMYSAPGIRDYLNYEFRTKLSELDILHFQCVKDITMIDLESLFRSTVLGKKFDLKLTIDKYLKSVAKRKGKWEKTKKLSYHLKMFPQFEAVNNDVFSGMEKPDFRRVLKLIGYEE